MLGARRLSARSSECAVQVLARITVDEPCGLRLCELPFQGNFDAGIKEFTAALEADPNYERAYFGRAECLRCKGQLREAEVRSVWHHTSAVAR